MDRVNATTSSIPSVGMTAVGVAAIRAAETSRPDRLFDDPCAARFVQAAAYVRPGATTHPTEDEVRRRRRLKTWVAVRTRFLDEVVTDACNGSCRQVVIVGAGLDARAFRLAWPAGTRLWELDLAEVLAFKEMVVQAEEWVPRCERIPVDVDLSQNWGLGGRVRRARAGRLAGRRPPGLPLCGGAGLADLIHGGAFDSRQPDGRHVGRSPTLG
jgi:O-methyltransferase involved in polyketide biosynthesis